MCAINGITWQDSSVVKRMCASNASRGPDGTKIVDSKMWTIGHNLLKINGSDAKSSLQPVVTSQRNVLAFNGNVYDIDPNIEFDTDWLARNLDLQGVDFLRNVNGGFAIAWVDTKKDILYLVRDHFGVKPMFWAQCPQGLVFSSTIWAIIESKKINPEIDEQMLHTLSGKGNFWLKGRSTPYKNIHKLEPGGILKYDLRKKVIIGFGSVWEDFQFTPSDYNRFDYRSRVINAINDTCRTKQKLAISLSGGLDSNLIAAVQGIQGSTNQFAITLAYDNPDRIPEDPTGALQSEWELASQTAEEYKLKHIVEVFNGSKKNLVEYSKRSLAVTGSPFEDTFRMIPRYVLARRAAKEGAKVIVSGEGGDEVFSGYWMHKKWIDNPNAITESYVRRWVDKDPLLESWFPRNVLGPDNYNNMLFVDLLSRCETHLLRADAMAGAFSMESRAPFVHQDFAKYCFGIPWDIKSHYKNDRYKGINKHLIRNVFKDIIPTQIVDRADKVGWTLPMHRGFNDGWRQNKQDNIKWLKDMVQESIDE